MSSNVPPIPKFRFPKFRNSKGWEPTLLGEVLFPTERELNKPENPYTGMGLRSHGKGTFLKPLEDPAKNSMERLYEVKQDDLVVSITFAWEGAIAIAGKNDDGALVSHRFPTYTFNKKKVSPDFFRYVIVDKRFVHSLGVISPGGAGRNRVMNKNDFLKLSVLLPNIFEQRAIAEGLISLDEQIETQDQKVDALRKHRNGLMQRLFPREGETRPRLRFKEFLKHEDWQQRAIHEVCKILNNRRRPVASDLRVSGPYPYYGASGIVDYINDYIFAERLLLVGEDGAKWTAFERTAFIADGKYWVNNHAHVLKATGVVDSFIENFLTKIDISPYVTGAAPPKLTLGKLKDIPILIPPSTDEQQCIADSLTSLDRLTIAESKKLIALKSLKKGLMQRLFPSADEFES